MACPGVLFAIKVEFKRAFFVLTCLYLVSTPFSEWNNKISCKIWRNDSICNRRLNGELTSIQLFLQSFNGHEIVSSIEFHEEILAARLFGVALAV